MAVSRGYACLVEGHRHHYVCQSISVVSVIMGADPSVETAIFFPASEAFKLPRATSVLHEETSGSSSVPLLLSGEQRSICYS